MLMLTERVWTWKQLVVEFMAVGPWDLFLCVVSRSLASENGCGINKSL